MVEPSYDDITSTDKNYFVGVRGEKTFLCTQVFDCFLFVAVCPDTRLDFQILKLYNDSDARGAFAERFLSTL